MPVARAQDEPAKDHPSVPRFPGMAMESGSNTDFDSFEFQLGDEKSKTVEGKSWQFTYQLKDGARQPSPLEVVRNYSNQFKARGGRVLYQEPGNSEVTMMRPLGAGERWLHLYVNNNGSQIMMAIIETAAMRQKVEFSADEMAQQLESGGILTLRGILFDTGKAEIKAESGPLVDEIAAMLKTSATLRLRIQGHTDNVGAKAANLTLSRDRAAAVMAALVTRGIEVGRLAATGFGDTKPVADNGTGEGRQQNRRVEFVKQ